MKINTEVIKALKPCPNRLDNWMQYYSKFNGDVSKFFKLENVTHSDKLWVVLRLVDQDTRIIFALDCTFSSDAAAYAAAYCVDVAMVAAAYYDMDIDYYTAVAAHTTAYAYNTTNNTIDRKKEEQNQLDVLLYLIKGDVK